MIFFINIGLLISASKVVYAHINTSICRKKVLETVIYILSNSYDTCVTLQKHIVSTIKSISEELRSEN